MAAGSLRLCTQLPPIIVFHQSYQSPNLFFRSGGDLKEDQHPVTLNISS